TARSAQRSGAGYVRLSVPGADASVEAPAEAVVVGLPEVGWADAVAADIERFAVLVIGPGLGTRPAVLAEAAGAVGAVTVPTGMGCGRLGLIQARSWPVEPTTGVRWCSPPTTGSSPRSPVTHRVPIGSPRCATWLAPPARWCCSRGRPPWSPALRAGSWPPPRA